MRLALAQLNPTLGDISANSKKILRTLAEAEKLNVDLIVFPELFLLGYPPQDLLERSQLITRQLKSLNSLHNQIPKSMTVILGAATITPNLISKPFFNSAVVLEKDKPVRLLSKKCLPTYDIFDETRFFAPGGQRSNILTIKGKKIHISICEDMWATSKFARQYSYSKNPFQNLSQPIDAMINLSASPFSVGKTKHRKEIAATLAKKYKAPFVYVNCVGAQDEIIFDGGSFVMNSKGAVLLSLPQFEEKVEVFELPLGKNQKTSTTSVTPKKEKHIAKKLSEGEELRQAIVLGIKDYCRKTGFKKLHLGLSGGIDSAVVAALAVEAVGGENVALLAMPGPFSAKQSLVLAKKQAAHLGCEFFEIPISPIYEQLNSMIKMSFSLEGFGVMQENLQSRLRGLLLMAFSNSHNSMLLTTGNKSEYATGYATLYGDMNGGLAPIGDCLKSQVYLIAKNLNKKQELVPTEVIERAPSAELRPNQKDEDSLPPYDILDASVRRLVEEQKPVKSDVDKWLMQILMKTEFKRWQAAPILRVSQHSFGRGRRWPIAHRSRLEDI